MTPRFRRGTRSVHTKVEMDIRPPPPIPATTLPKIITFSSRANPHIRFPAAKKRLLKIRPGPLPNISVNRPEMGWQAFCTLTHLFYRTIPKKLKKATACDHI